MSSYPLICLQDLKLGSHEMNRLRGADLRNLLREKKLILVLDLDHTLLNSTRLADVIADEDYLLRQVDFLQGTPHRKSRFCKLLSFLSYSLETKISNLDVVLDVNVLYYGIILFVEMNEWYGL